MHSHPPDILLRGTVYCTRLHYTGKATEMINAKRCDQRAATLAYDNDNDVYYQGKGAPLPSQLGLNLGSSSRLGPTVLIL